MLFLPFWLIQLLMPRNKNLWVFGSWYGERFADNSMYLYKYTHAQAPQIRGVWIKVK